MMELAVKCSNVEKQFGSGPTEVRALRGIDLEVRKGELFMLVGPSGSGKTTLISIIAGILQQTSGCCEVLGQPLEELSEPERVRLRKQEVGFVFQSFHLVPSLTAAENVAIPLLLQGWERSKALAKAGEMLDQVGLGDRAKAVPGQLSGGERQRVAISRAVVHEPDVVVCDEPTSALDHKTGHKVMEIFRSIARQSERALIVVTHDARIFEFADRIAMMDDGVIKEIIDDPSKL
jgi:putative ABC transport system ATP-binding protein